MYCAVIIYTEITFDSQSHHYWLSEVNATISITCTMTCGECYDDYWNIQLNGTLWILYDNYKAEELRSSYPEFTVELVEAPDICDSSLSSVTSSLLITLNEESVRSTKDNLIISCGIACGPSFRLPTVVSAVVYLPLSNYGTDPPTGSVSTTVDPNPPASATVPTPTPTASATVPTSTPTASAASDCGKPVHSICQNAKSICSVLQFLHHSSYRALYHN